MINVKLQVAGYRLQVVWVISEELSLATCRLELCLNVSRYSY